MKEIYYKNKLTAVGNHIKLKKYQDFDAGTRTGLTLEETPDGAVLQLKAAGEADGTWISPVIAAESPFNDLIVSWNTSTPRGTDVEVFARVYLPEYDGWRIFYSSDKENPGASYNGASAYSAFFDADFVHIPELDEKVDMKDTLSVRLYEVKKTEDKLYLMYAHNYMTDKDFVLKIINNN